MLSEAYAAGQQRGAVVLEKLAGRGAATALGGMFPLFSGLAAEDGQGMSTSGGALLGSVGGQIAGGALGAGGGYLASLLARRPDLANKLVSNGAFGGSVLGGVSGGAAGAYMGHGPNRGEDKVAHRKVASPERDAAMEAYYSDLLKKHQEDGPGSRLGNAAHAGAHVGLSGAVGGALGGALGGSIGGANHAGKGALVGGGLMGLAGLLTGGALGAALPPEYLHNQQGRILRSRREMYRDE